MRLLIKNVFQYYGQYKLRSSIYFIGTLFDLAVQSFIALSFKYLLDNAIQPKDQRVMVLVLALLVSGTVISRVGYAFRCYLYSKMLAGIICNLRNRLFSRMQQYSMRYYCNAETGDILTHFSTDIESIQYLVNMAVPAGVSALLAIVVNSVIIFVLEWKLALFSVVGLFLCALGPYLFSNKASRANDAMKEKQAQLLSMVEENISAQQTIKSFDLLRVVKRDFEEKTAQLSQMTSKAFFLNDVMEMTPNSIIEVFNVLMISGGAVLAFNNYITGGTLVSFNNLYVGLSTSIGAFTWVFPVLMESSASMKRIQGFMDNVPEVVNREGAKEIKSLESEIEFSDVTFCYTEKDVCLKNLNLHIRRGLSVAIVGQSGSGKSSVLNLVMRFYDPKEGSVSIDGLDIRNITMESLHHLIGIVLQENFLFNTTIRENLKLANPGATDEDIVEAARAAEIHDYIMSLPDGYDTPVGKRGGKLSGGQRQRIALARALVCNPAILILDEATSALDPKTENAINETLKRIMAERTVINITHRLSSIKDYDQIYVMEKGSVAESGTHAELMKKGGIYAEQSSRQSGFIIDDKMMKGEVEPARLSKIHLFKHLDEAMLEELSELFISEYYAAGKTIIYAGDQADRFYVIARGRVEVFITLEDGKEKRLNILDDGDYFGEIALLKEMERAANVRTCTPCILLSLQKRQFARTLSKVPGLKAELEKKMDSYLAG